MSCFFFSMSDSLALSREKVAAGATLGAEATTTDAGTSTLMFDDDFRSSEAGKIDVDDDGGTAVEGGSGDCCCCCCCCRAEGISDVERSEF